MTRELFSFLALSVGPVIIIGVGIILLKILRNKDK